MKKLLQTFSAPWLMAVILPLFACSIAVATFVENNHGSEEARRLIYGTTWFEVILILGSLNLFASIIVRKLYTLKKLSVFIFHAAFILIVLGAGLTRYTGFEGTMQIREGGSSDIILSDINKLHHKLPFKLELLDFIIDYYPGSENPSGFESKVRLIDPDEGINQVHKIYMNNILKYKGYRFYQSSYHDDLKGTVLSVSKDPLGNFITYSGYLLLTIGMLWSLFNRNSRFIKLLFNKVPFVLLMLIPAISNGNSKLTDSVPVIPAQHAQKFGNILVRDVQGRTKPLNTQASDVFRKIYRKKSFGHQEPIQVMLGILVYPEKWQYQPLVYTGSLAVEYFKLKSNRTSLIECYRGQGIFISSQPSFIANQKAPATRTKTENAIIKFDERLNIIYHWFMGNMLTIFPSPSDSTTEWFTPITIQGKVKTADSIFVNGVFSLYLEEVRKSVISGDWSVPDEIIKGIIMYQNKHGIDLPAPNNVRLEVWYYKSDIFTRSAYIYIILGLLLFIVYLVITFSEKQRLFLLKLILSGGITGVLVLHSTGLALRWYISGHAPWSNAYETMVFIAWSAVLCGVFFLRKNILVLALAAIMSSIFLITANLSWMDPQITNLVPVLKSKWLVIHVAVITSSYGFLGIAAIMAFVNLILISVQTKKNFKLSGRNITGLNHLIEIIITIGLYLLTIGTFLGAIWANVSWGRYWAWDPKETWALITIIVYAFVLHIRLIPGLKSKVLFNILSLISFASVLMTYFGVNYYLSGLHSYAQGDPAPVPASVYYSLAIVTIVSVTAILNSKRLASKK